VKRSVVVLVLAAFVIQAMAAQTSVKPLRDANAVLSEIDELIDKAELYVHVVAWAFDDELRFAADSQHARGTPVFSRRSAYSQPHGDVENLNCSKPDDPSSAIVRLRCKATELAKLREATFRPWSGEWLDARAEIMILVWDDPIDNTYNSPMTNLDDLGYVLVNERDLIKWSDQELYAQMRERGSGESVTILKAFRDEYRKHFGGTNFQVPMPSGIEVMQQKNNNNLKASQHQKIVETDVGGYLGGVNFEKEFWDTDDHEPLVPERWTSTATGFLLPAVPVFDDVPGPLHDTGAIVRGQDVRRINEVFRARWDSNLPPSFAGVAGSSTPFEPLRRALQAQAQTNPAARVLTAYIKRLEHRPFATRPFSPPNIMPDANYPASNITVATSRPSRSYKDRTSPQEIRTAYNDAIGTWMHGAGSFAYFESQFARDHDFFLQIFRACYPRDHVVATWCHRDRFAYFVVPYKPFTLPSTVGDLLFGIQPEIVKEEMQNFMWMEIKTANAVQDRVTAQPIVELTTGPEGCPPCPCDSSRDYPFIRFQSSAVEGDPGSLTLDSIVTMRGRPPGGQVYVVDCNAGTGPPIFKPCYDPTKVISKKVREIITDSAFMSYVLANPGASGKRSLPPSSGQDNYHNALEQFGIYIHSKHSEFFGERDVGGTVSQRLIYVMGSANLDTRSLGQPHTPNSQKDAEDSEINVFWTPPNHDFTDLLWGEHADHGKALAWPAGIQTWADEGWKNWRILHTFQLNDPTQRVVRLDAVERCLRYKGCS
jgi:phosphatidylserine/phosphatidylglycerophosphate/cardiolipin synthase-like enzyme